MKRKAYSIFPDNPIAEFMAIAGVSTFVKTLAVAVSMLSLMQLSILLLGYRPIQICAKVGDYCTLNGIMWANFALIAALLATVWINLKAETLLSLAKSNRNMRSHFEILKLLEALVEANLARMTNEAESERANLESIEQLRQRWLSWMNEAYYEQFPGGAIGANLEGEIVELMGQSGSVFQLASLSRKLAFDLMPKVLAVATLTLTIAIGLRLIEIQ